MFPMLKNQLDPRIRFAVLFGGLSVVLFAFYFFPYAENGESEAWLTRYLEKYTSLVGGLLAVVEPHLVVSHNQIVGRFSMSIIRSCDGMEANILLCAALLATPGVWWRKAVALAAGLTALAAFNVLRLCCLYYIGVYFPAHFEFAHFDAWPLLIIVFALVDFLVCVRWIQGVVPPSAPEPVEPAHVPT
jgi:exosortase/archaeosortase family protein